MGCSIPPELSLDVKPTYIPKTVSDFLGELSSIGSVPERLVRLDDFVKRLEEEMKKIEAFKRELPLCMLLINDAIATLKEESVQCRRRNVEPVLEEFIPLKRNPDDDGDGDERSEVKKEKESKDKMSWMRSVQLWNSDFPKSNNDRKQNFVKEGEEQCGSVSDDPFQSGKNRTRSRAFLPFKGCSVFPARKEEELELPAAGLSLLTPGIKNPSDVVGSNGFSSKTSGGRAIPASAQTGQSNLRAGPQPQTSRKQRRCWSPELHRRFVSALQQLGGSQVATPKQIRELMQVDGLTNDEVKSHLQKYRLHTRRLPAAAPSTTPSNQSMVMLGGLWVPQDQFSESSKPTNSQSGSPQGPLHLAGAGGGTSTTGGDSMEEEEEEKSESYGWKSHINKAGKDDV